MQDFSPRKVVELPASSDEHENETSEVLKPQDSDLKLDTNSDKNSLDDDKEEQNIDSKGLFQID